MSLFRRSNVEAETETVACDRCGHIVLKSHTTSVLRNSIKVWYCSEHRPLYDECFSNYYTHPPIRVYFRRMHVDEFGEPIGYKKTEKP